MPGFVSFIYQTIANSLLTFKAKTLHLTLGHMNINAAQTLRGTLLRLGMFGPCGSGTARRKEVFPAAGPGTGLTPGGGGGFSALLFSSCHSVSEEPECTPNEH